MTFKRVLILFILAFPMQMTLVNLISIGGITPNFILCMMVVICYLYDDGYRSIPFAIIFGLFLDICSGGYVGVAPFAMFLSGIFATISRRWLNPEKLRTMMAAGGVCVLIYEVLYWTIMKVLGNSMSFIYMLSLLPFFIAYNVAVMVVMFLLMHKQAEAYHNERFSL